MNFITKSKARQKSAEVYTVDDITRLKNYQSALIDHLIYSNAKNKYIELRSANLSNALMDEIKLIEAKLKRLAEEVVMNNNRKFAQ